LAALEAPAAEDRAIGHAEEVAVAEHPELLEVAEATASLPRPTRVRRERQPLDHQGKARLGELHGEVLAVGDDVDGVGAVGIEPPARAAAQHLAHEIEVTVLVETVE